MSPRQTCIVNPTTKKRTGNCISNKNLIIAVAGILVIVYAIYVLVAEAFKAVPIDFTAYHVWLEKISWATGIGSIIIAVFAIIVMVEYKEIDILMIVPAAIGAFIVIWVDYLRPIDADILNSLTTFVTFQNLIIAMEIVLLAILAIAIFIRRARK